MMQFYFKNIEILKHKICNQGYWNADFIIISYFLLNTESQVDFDRLLQLHMLDKTEEDKRFVFKMFKVV
jgi:hypothetical protein